MKCVEMTDREFPLTASFEMKTKSLALLLQGVDKNRVSMKFVSARDAEVDFPALDSTHANQGVMCVSRLVQTLLHSIKSQSWRSPETKLVIVQYGSLRLLDW